MRKTCDLKRSIGTTFYFVKYSVR